MYIFLNSSAVYHAIQDGNLLSFCLDVAQGHMKGAPNETRTHS